jgi:hypothetical protein
VKPYDKGSEPSAQGGHPTVRSRLLQVLRLLGRPDIVGAMAIGGLWVVSRVEMFQWWWQGLWKWWQPARPRRGRA